MRDIQSFLAAIDPLRKYEFDWRSMPGFDKRLMMELAAQQLVNKRPYRNMLNGKILRALAGVMLPEPGHKCHGIEQARSVCEDHGEDWNTTLNALVKALLLRRDPNGDLSISGPGCLLLTKTAQEVVKLKVSTEKAGNLLFERLSGDARLQLGALKLDMGNQSASLPREFPEVQLQRTKTDSPVRVLKQGVPKVKPPVKDVGSLTNSKPTLSQVIRVAEQRFNSPMAVLNQLQQQALIGCTTDLHIIEEEPVTIWKCELTIPAPVGQVFTGVGRSQKEARALAAEPALKELKRVVSSGKPSKILVSDHHNQRQEAKLRPWPVGLR